MALADNFELVSRNEDVNADDSVGAKLAREVGLIGMATDRLETALEEKAQHLKEKPMQEGVKPFAYGVVGSFASGMLGKVSPLGVRYAMIAGAAALAGDLVARASQPMVEVWNDGSKMEPAATRLSQIAADTIVTGEILAAGALVGYRLLPKSPVGAWNTSIGPATSSLSHSGLEISAATRGVKLNPYVASGEAAIKRIDA